MSGPEKAVMARIRFRVVFILLVLILLIASAIFGLLTYWLDREPPPVSGSKSNRYHRFECNRASGSGARTGCRAELYITELTPVMGAHTGPGVLGVVFYVE